MHQPDDPVSDLQRVLEVVTAGLGAGRGEEPCDLFGVFGGGLDFDFGDGVEGEAAGFAVCAKVSEGERSHWTFDVECFVRDGMKSCWYLLVIKC